MFLYYRYEEKNRNNHSEDCLSTKLFKNINFENSINNYDLFKMKCLKIMDNSNIYDMKIFRERFKEIYNDTGINNMGKHGELTKWAQNGILLLNSVLTVRAGQPKSHRNIGWEEFTTEIIKLLNLHEKPIVFMLWGGDAKAKAKFITNKQHCVLKAAHPSPLSAYNGFFGCKHFSQANEFLRNNGLDEIDWSID